MGDIRACDICACGLRRTARPDARPETPGRARQALPPRATRPLPARARRRPGGVPDCARRTRRRRGRPGDAAPEGADRGRRAPAPARSNSSGAGGCGRSQFHRGACPVRVARPAGMAIVGPEECAWPGARPPDWGAGGGAGLWPPRGRGMRGAAGGGKTCAAPRRRCPRSRCRRSPERGRTVRGSLRVGPPAVEAAGYPGPSCPQGCGRCPAAAAGGRSGATPCRRCPQSRRRRSPRRRWTGRRSPPSRTGRRTGRRRSRR